MGKHGGQSKKQEHGQSSDGGVKKNKGSSISSPKPDDNDTAVFISMSQELKEEGNKLFQKRDHEGAMLKYEKAIKLLPSSHIDISHLRSNMAACYMQMGITEYPRAIHECNLALEVTPKYSKALIKRAKCYEALNSLDLALRDVDTVLKVEVNNMMAMEIGERVRYALERKGLQVNGTVIELPPDHVEPPFLLSMPKLGNKRSRKKKSKKVVERKTTGGETEEMSPGNETEEKTTVDEIKEKKVDSEESKVEDKVVVEEKISSVKEEPKQNIKLVLGEDIRCAQLPLNCSLMKLREVVYDRFPGTGDVFIKYRDKEGDLVTITCDEELRWAEAAAKTQNSVRLHLVRGNSLQDRFFDAPEGKEEEEVDTLHMKQKLDNGNGNGNVENEKQPANGGYYIDEWIVQFAKMFKDHVGVDSNAYPGLRDVGLKFYSEALEETVTSEEAQGFFDTAAGKFQEMAALGLFYWGNVYMSRARKTIYFTEDASRESIVQQIATAYDWALKEYIKAGQRFEEALRIKPDLYEAHLALGQQQFEQAKLSWYYAVSNHANLEKWPSEDVVKLYIKAEDSMERGMEMWEEMAMKRLSSIASTKIRASMQKGLDCLFQDISIEEANEQIRNMRSQMNLIWATILYERSVMEFRLGIPVWRQCFEVAIEKFELAGASPTDIAVMTKNHVSGGNVVEGFGFTIDEIVQAWNEMYAAKKLLIGIPSFRLEPLLRLRVSIIHHAFELL